MVNWNFTTNGMIIDATTGERPKPTPQELIATRAVQVKDGWVGQIVMSGEIVFETEPQADDEAEDAKGSEIALGLVNRRITAAFRALIVGDLVPFQDQS